MDENSNQSINLQDQLPNTAQQIISTKKSSHFLHDILDMKSEDTIINSSLDTTVYLSSLMSSLANNSITNNLAFSLALNNTLNNNNNNNSININTQMSANRNRLVECVVCHDKSSGKHYGQYTCEGCKSFFKRSVRRNLTYQCRANKQCPIDQHHRNQCQHCRFKKCIRMGMRREAVQRGRTPIDHQINNSNNNIQSNKLKTKDTNNKLALPPPPLAPSSRLVNDFSSEFASKILFNIFEWSISIPIFSTISLNDRIELLVNSWRELFVLFAAQSNIVIDDLKLDDERENTNTTTTNSSINNSITSSNSSDEQDMDNFKLQLNKIRSLNLDYEEYNYFRAIVLFNPDSLKLENKELIENYQNNFQISLSQLSNLKDKTKLRFGKILLLLKSTCHFIHKHSIESLFFKYMFLLSTDYSSIEQLIKKLLKWNFDSTNTKTTMSKVVCDTTTTMTSTSSSLSSDLPNAALILNAYYTSFINSNKKNYFDFFTLNNLYPSSNKS